MSNVIVRLHKNTRGADLASLPSPTNTYLPNLGILIADKNWMFAQQGIRPNEIISMHEEGVFSLPEAQEGGCPVTEDQEDFTWGLQAINWPSSFARGVGAKVCVLDTGLDVGHPDLQHINPDHMKSMVNGVSVKDTNGHGTHCAGTITGRKPKNGPAYGVAPECDLFVGKVFSDGANPGATEGDILKGIEWAVENRCNVISMSLGSYRGNGDPPYALYEELATKLLYGGAVAADPSYTCLLLAAAGNSSNRPRKVAPIGNPAACRGFHAVAAIDSNLDIAYFSCGNTDGMSPIFCSMPGVDVYSSWIGKGYKSISGTSMATPHAAGVAALYIQAFRELGVTPTAKTIQRYMELVTMPLGNERDFGPGLPVLIF